MRKVAVPSTPNSTSCAALGVVQRVIGRREPLPRVGIVEVERLAGDFARDGVGPVGRQAVLLGIDARGRVQPAIGHRDDVPQGVGHRVVEGPRRERRADQERPAVLGELGVGLRRTRRDLAMPDRVERLPARASAGPLGRVGDPGDGARSGRSPAPCRRQGRSGDAPGTSPRAGRVMPISRLPIGSKVGCAVGVLRLARTPASPAPAASRGCGPGR